MVDDSEVGDMRVFRVVDRDVLGEEMVGCFVVKA